MKYTRLPNETDNELLFRIAKNKENDNLTWQDVADIMNSLTENNFSESCYRKRYSDFDKMYNSNLENLYGEEVADDLTERQESLYKQQVKTRDAIREHRALLRDEARIEALKEAIIQDSIRYNPKVQEYRGDYNGTRPAILNVGDWHIGNCTHNFYNSYNLEIAEARINELADQTIKYAKLMNVKTLNILNLGDLIENALHITARVQNEIDAIEQIKCAARLLFMLIVKLANNIEQITYRSVVDNHSRANIDYKQHIEKESFCKLIDWWLEEKISAYNAEHLDSFGAPIKICYDNIDDNIGYLEINEKNIFFTHGHIGNQNTITQDLTFGTGIIADAVILGHWHTDKIKNYQAKKVFFNGSLKGVDDYALNRRLFSMPSQTMLIFDESTIIDIPIDLS